MAVLPRLLLAGLCLVPGALAAQRTQKPALHGRLTLRADTPPWVRRELREMGYRLDFQDRTSGPINAIFFDWKHGSLWGGSSNHAEDYGIAW